MVSSQVLLVNIEIIAKNAKWDVLIRLNNLISSQIPAMISHRGFKLIRNGKCNV